MCAPDDMCPTSPHGTHAHPPVAIDAVYIAYMYYGAIHIKVCTEVRKRSNVCAM